MDTIEYVVRGTPYELTVAACRKCRTNPATYTIVDNHGHYDQCCADCTISAIVELRDKPKGW